MGNRKLVFKLDDRAVSPVWYLDAYPSPLSTDPDEIALYMYLVCPASTGASSADALDRKAKQPKVSYVVG